MDKERATDTWFIKTPLGDLVWHTSNSVCGTTCTLYVDSICIVSFKLGALLMAVSMCGKPPKFVVTGIMIPASTSVFTSSWCFPHVQFPPWPCLESSIYTGQNKKRTNLPAICLHCGGVVSFTSCWNVVTSIPWNLWNFWNLCSVGCGQEA